MGKDEENKINKYIDLTYELKDLRRVDRVNIIPIVIPSIGTIQRNLFKSQEELEQELHALGVPRREHITRRYIKDVNWLTMRQRWIVQLLLVEQTVLLTKYPAYVSSKLSFRSHHHSANLSYVGYTLDMPPINQHNSQSACRT
ncbi:unnamed protein product [Acanthoscelides obtectus]|uniref:Uncharacterized protein n=1 Tax=Acanthoscelides obtectus TaxID=200917 RepID=A0A9P0QBG6_ACAOB|nr:unnamed protein product [Acanthoscelides obtectus]CAK1623177.1 hypothetical protein AOBTE_LOCUS1860 [Acanthoscelides obtectus]